MGKVSYSLTLHDEDGKRLIGFDNAHPVRPKRGPGGRKDKKHDHKHRLQKIKSYEYTNAETLLIDFWNEVDLILKERGVLK